MATWKAPRSCLSESLREYEDSALRKPSEGIVTAHGSIKLNSCSMEGEVNTWDPMTELDSILHSANNNFDPTVVFGCTPPRRSTNPICRDRNFTTSKTISHLTTKSFKTPCKDNWSFMGATNTCPTFH